MIDTENVTCDTCTAPSEFVFDASDEQSRGWPRLDIGLNPFKGDFPCCPSATTSRSSTAAPPPSAPHAYSRLKSASTRP